MMRKSAILGSGMLLALVAGCGGSGGSDGTPTPPSPPPVITMTSKDAARLLEQASFGPTPSEVTRVAALGLNGYLQEQTTQPATGYSGFSFVTHTAPATCQYDPTAPTGAASLCSRDNYSLYQVQRQFFENALTGQDQLRQRVAFALSQIFVVSGTEIYEAYGMAGYQNLLLDDAFVNFRQLMEDVTLSPVMGRYLSMVQNTPPNPKTGALPNENYARELMQLFSIGLYQLNPDGSLKLDANSQPQPTYDPGTVQGFAAVFTGWVYPPLNGAEASLDGPINYQGTMAAVAAYHDTDSKTILNGVIVPAGGTAEADLKIALDTIFNHPNVGPFIGKQLIQHLVTSNPSPAYVARISAVFADNGQGVRGDMAAVVKAILSDTEARGDAPADADSGHLREPALFLTTLMRELGGHSDGVYLRSQSSALGQPIYDPPTVFNFYPPDYQLPGKSTLGPEFFIHNAATALARANFVNQVLFRGGAAADPTVTGSTGTSIDLTPLLSTPAATPAQLVDQLNTQMMHGSLSSAATSTIASAVQAAATTDPLAPLETGAYLIATSPQYSVEH